MRSASRDGGGFVHDIDSGVHRWLVRVMFAIHLTGRVLSTHT
jgi:hypothetical protein